MRISSPHLARVLWACRNLRHVFFPALCLLTAMMGSNDPLQAKVESQRYHEFWGQHTLDDFAHWTFNGTAVENNRGKPAIQLAPFSGNACSSADIDGGSVYYDAAAGLCSGTDPYEAGQYEGRNYYNGSTFYFGTLISPVQTPEQPVHTLIVSWNATTPPGTWLQVHVRVRENDAWTHWYKLPIWASDNETIKRHSIDGQEDASGRVDTDMFATRTPATAYQIGLTLFSTTAHGSPTVHGVTAIAANDGNVAPQIAPDVSVWGHNLEVPRRSQMLPEYRGQEYGGGGEVWCSPISTSMVMAYWAAILRRPELDRKGPDVARDTYDFTYEGTGNWPFNTAYAGRYGLRAFVTRLYSMSQAEQWIKAGVPLVIALSYEKGELPGTPIAHSNGHLLVVRGFTKSGDVITNDPAATTNEALQIVYKRAAIEAVWLKYSQGTAYVIYPEDWPTPEEKRLTNW